MPKIGFVGIESRSIYYLSTENLLKFIEMVRFLTASALNGFGGIVYSGFRSRGTLSGSA